MTAKSKLIIWFCLAIFGLLIYVVLDTEEFLVSIQDGKSIQQYVLSLGYLGPVMIIVMMSVAIMVSPLPSAPIAIAAGAAYGHSWGALYVLLGSLSGACGAFAISRYLGYEAIKTYAEQYLPRHYYHSQKSLMGIVLISRLLPFLSFDVLSYAAGLTPLVFWRFALATLIGIAPASFFLAHIGSEMASAEWQRIGWALLLLVLLSMLVTATKMLRSKSKDIE